MPPKPLPPTATAQAPKQKAVPKPKKESQAGTKPDNNGKTVAIWPPPETETTLKYVVPAPLPWSWI